MSTITLNKLAEISSGQGAPQGEKCFGHKGLPFVRAGSLDFLLSGGKEDVLERVSEEVANEYQLKPYLEGTILFAKSGMSATKDRVYTLKSTCYVVNHLAAIIPKKTVDSDFLKFWFRYFRPSQLIKDKAYPSIRLSDIEEIKVPDFSDDKKRHIISILEKAESAKQKRKESIRLADEFLKSTFLDIFGDPISNTKGWEYRKLGEALDVRDGTHDTPKYIAEGIPLITSKNLKDGKIDFDNIFYISQADYEQIIKRSFVETGDILYGMIGTIGSPVIVNTDRKFGIKNVALFKFRGRKVNNYYIKTLFEDDFLTKKLLSEKRGGNQKFVSLDILRNFNIPLPPFELQQEFAALVQKVEALKSKQQTSAKELDNLFNSLMQKAFKGELFDN